MEFSTLPEMFAARAKDRMDKRCSRYKYDGQWREFTWGDMVRIVEEMAGGLIEKGVKAGDHVALISENRSEWAQVDFAVLSIGAADVPIYATSIVEQCVYIIQNAETKVAFCSNAGQYKKLLEVRKQIKLPEVIIVFDDIGEQLQKGDYILENFLKLGREKGHRAELDKRLKAIDPDDTATLIYTSGTTGPPKGVMLTHKNLLSDVDGLYEQNGDTLSKNEVGLSFLPLSHSFERTVGHYFSMYHADGEITYLVDVKQVIEAFAEVRPTILTSVPRIYEKIYEGVNERRQAASKIARVLIDWSMKVGNEWAGKDAYGKPISALLQFKYNLAYKILFSKIYNGLGGRMKLAASGGAPLAAHIGRFMYACGIPVYEGYGLTETSPAITATAPGKIRFGRVGKPLHNVEIKIAEDGEVLVKGPTIMKGYYKLPEKTKEVIDSDGWFHTGDIGLIDEDGYLQITDRKKDIIVTAGGKNIAPQNIENHMKLCRSIEQICVVGDKRPFCTALVVPNFEILVNVAKENGWPTDQEWLAKSDEVKQMIEDDIARVNKDLARYETVKYFRVLPEEFTEENKMLTPTMKLKRAEIMRHYKDLIDEMYLSAKRT
jgi:long-chain acyl-CoA synthetase